MCMAFRLIMYIDQDIAKNVKYLKSLEKTINNQSINFNQLQNFFLKISMR